MQTFSIDAVWAARLGARLVKQREAGATTLTISMVRGPVYETIVVESWFPDDSSRTHRIKEPRDRARSKLERSKL